MAGLTPLLLQHFLGSGPLPHDSSRDRASPALSKHAGGGRLHNSFPISCALQDPVDALAAKCNVSPLTPTPAAQPAVTQPDGFPGPTASGCALRRQPSFSWRVRPGPFLPCCGVILPSPSLEKGPCAFALSRGTIRAVPCRQAPACLSGEVDINSPMPSTSFEVLFFHSFPTKTRAVKIQIKKKPINILPLLLPRFLLLLLLLLSPATPAEGSKWEGGAVHERRVEIGLRKLMLDFNRGLSLQSAVIHPAQGTRLENIGPSGRGGTRSPPVSGRVECRHPAPPHSQPSGPGFLLLCSGCALVLSLCRHANPLQVCSLNHLHKISPEDHSS